MKRLIGTSPTVIKHERRIKQGNDKQKKGHNITMNESLADLSIMSGDVSIHVVHNVKRS